MTVEGVDPLELFGQNNAKLHLLRNAFPQVQITSRGNQVRLSGKKKYTQNAKAKFESMVRYLRERNELPIEAIHDMLNGNDAQQRRGDQQLTNGTSDGVILHSTTGKPIRAKTENQKKLVTLCASHDIVFAIGPAGTGKTYTAVAIAVHALKNRMVKKIILTRPAVEAGENLGFLPGDLKEKVDPYLRPLYDALDDMIQPDKLRYFMDHRIIEVAPLAFMRGRTLDHAFIILDEAQNATQTQVKMFLTRLGPSAKCVLTGDLSQIDLPPRQQSGLFKALDILSNVDGIGKVYLDANDVVRHRLVKDIIRAFDKDDLRRRNARARDQEES